MFRDLVLNPIDPIPQEYISNYIRRIANEPDYSLTCLGLAMLKSRINNYEGFDGCFNTYSRKESALEDFAERIKTVSDHPMFCYYKYTNDSDCSNFIKEHFDGYKEKKSIETFVKEKASCDCIVLYHEEKNVVGIFVNSGDIRVYHLMLSFMSLYYPSLFKDAPLGDKDFNLIKSLSDKDKNRFYACIKDLVMPYKFEFRKLQLSGIMKQMHKEKIDAAARNISSQRDIIKDIEMNYADAIKILKDLIVVYEGLKVVENFDDAEKELCEYLATNDNIHNISFNRQCLRFCVSTLLTGYNADAWATFAERGYIYDGEYGVNLPNVYTSKENRKRIFDAIFSDDPLLMVRMAGNYSINLSNCSVGTDMYYDYQSADPMFINYIPNPHLAKYACLGGYKNEIPKAMREGNYITAIELCIASAGSVNLDETTQTFRPFLGWILTNKNKVLVTKDGHEFTPEEALIWLIDKEKENATD